MAKKLKFSDEQLLAINERGKNIIVSASAGSGKTAVLTERIVNILSGEKDFDKGIKLDNLLVLTFTNAAAAEMKDRVRKRLLNDKSLSHLVDFVDTSKIMTFDGYSLYLVKKYYYVLGVDSNIQVADEYYLSVLTNKYIDEILEELYKDDHKLVNDYFEMVPGKDDNALKKGIATMLKEVMKLPNTFEFLNNYAKNFYTDENVEKIVSSYENIKYLQIKKLFKGYEEHKKNIIDIVSSIEDIIDEKDPDKHDEWTVSHIADYLNDFEEIKENPNYEEIKSYLKQCVFPSHNRKGCKEIQDLKTCITAERDQVKGFVNKNIENILKTMVFETRDEVKEFVFNQKKASDLFIYILKELIFRLDNYKKENNYYDFIDIAKLAIKLVEENADIREEISKELHEILIDEYQDTSDLQEYFINLIARDNVFMVGDIKQSIYRFRNANPIFFMKKYLDYKENKGGMKIDFKRNFRSRDEVLNNINLVFDKLMTLEYGDANYVVDHRMSFGQKDYNAYNPKSINFDFEIIKYDPKSLKVISEETDSSESEESKVPSDMFTNVELEAFYIAKDIKRRIDSKELVYDKDIEVDESITDPQARVLAKYRPCKYSDFCIIMDRGTNFEEFKKILLSKGIPVAINVNSEIKENETAHVISALIKLVALQKDNKINNDYYYALMSVGRSFICRESDEKLFQIIMESRNNKAKGIYKVFDNAITEKAKKVASYIDKYSNYDVYIKAIEEFNVLNQLQLIGDIEENMIVIEYLGNFIANMSSLGKSFYEISELVSGIFEANKSATYTLDVSTSPGVKITNMHKSKGLEFPICYFSLLDIKPKSEGLDTLGYFSDTGFYQRVKADNHSDYIDNPISIVALDLINQKTISERIRLFYVALTRTREKMILLSPKTDDTKTIIPEDFKKINDYLIYVKDLIKPYEKEISIDEVEMNKDYLITSSYYKLNQAGKNEFNSYDDKSYLGNELSKTRISKDMIEVLSEEELENVDLGLELHAELEMLDFANPDFESIENEKNKNIIKKIFNENKLFGNIAKAKTYHEHEFIMESSEKTYHGIIDLLAVYEDHIDIIDYKLNNIDHKEYDRQLSIYYEYVNKFVNKNNLPVKCYLLSLVRNKYREVVIK